MATDMLEHQPVQAVEVSRAPLYQRRRADTQAQGQNLDSTPENPTPLTKSGVAQITNADLADARFNKGDRVRKKASAPGGAQSKSAYTIYARRSSPHGWIEYQLQDYYTQIVDGSWTRERDLRAGA
ncbi:hypothetical protein BKA58DRAFT_383653 [Alternaria rosae]|uniref:uncharacterized protein n=1 Tax=Alternaria rosae TaxID=1187941 RepID=UPI001E8DE0C5|nr:uncharacterized protein BKA58DRAFT_383653 [Alternaria rosae]KAH6873208.1 hypothetical protein BKA58DRAFT_383653 [Alternaria rosae]